MIVFGITIFTILVLVVNKIQCYVLEAIISIPTSVKVFSYLSTYTSSQSHRHSNTTTTFLSFLSSFTLGGFTGLLLSSSHLDLILHDTYFVVAHFHTVLSLASLFGLLHAHYHFTPLHLTTGIHESISSYHTLLLGSSVSLIFLPMHFTGLIGMSRRIPEYSDHYLPLLIVHTHGSLLLLLVTLYNLRSWTRLMLNRVFGNYR